MIELRKAETPEQYVEIYVACKSFFVKINDEEFYGFYENGVCIGGASVSNNGLHEYRFYIDTKNSVGILKITWELFKIILPNHPVLTSKIQRSNVKSIKGTMQYGAIVAYKNSREVTLVFTKDMWSYQKRYPL